MKVIICLAAVMAVAIAYPANEGAAYTNEAIRQAQNSHLIPQGAQIQKVIVQELPPFPTKNPFFTKNHLFLKFSFFQ